MTKKGLKINYCVRTGGENLILTQNELLGMIFDETLSQTTKVQKEGESDWCDLNETAEWNQFFGTEREQKIWILLKRVKKENLSHGVSKARSKKDEKKTELEGSGLKGEGKKYKFQQKGPYSTRQISFFLKEGLCSDRDFVWKEPFKEWKKISLIKEFFTHPGQTIKDILMQEDRKYKPKRIKMIRYSPSQPPLDWTELQKKVQSLQKE